jgi:hypothetical protein
MGVLGEIRLYDFVLFVHIAAVVVAFGPTFAYPFFHSCRAGLATERPGNASSHAHDQPLPRDARPTRRACLRHLPDNRRVGLRSTVRCRRSRRRCRHDRLGATFFDRHEARLIELSKRDVAAVGAREGVLSADYWVVSKRFARVGIVASLLIVVALFFMAVKP